MAKTQRGVLSDAELLDYSGYHLVYEVQMLFVTAALMTRATGRITPVGEEERVVRFALLESFSLHLRNLIDLFYPNPKKKPHSTDVLADDFFQARKRPSTFPAISQSLTRARERASKEVAHLTKERIAGTPPEKEWRFLELTGEMCNILDEFVRAASPEKLHSIVGQQVRQVTSTAAGG
ncbi:MAG: hypothetical protein LAN70_11060 [Acidobacteriia bacterium]|nr:hypothetical protein [Terriglobia bacterium]